MAHDRKRDWLRRFARALSLAALLGYVSFSSGASADEEEAPQSADACVSFRDEAGEKQVVVSATNDCKLSLSCHLDYTVRCTDTEEKETSRSHRIARFLLMPKGNATVTLSAAVCKQSWAIDDFTWTCS